MHKQTRTNPKPPETAAAVTDGPQRRCLVLGASGDTENLIRFVVGPDGQLVADLAEKLPGRGLWVTADAECLATAQQKKLFSRAAKQPVSVPANFITALAQQLAARALSLLGLLYKSGQVQLGAEGVRTAAGKGKLSYILVAADASAAGEAELTGRRETPVLRLPLTAEQLGAAVGRADVVYLGLFSGKSTENLARALVRLALLRQSMAKQGLPPS